MPITWSDMDSQPTRRALQIREREIPDKPGVYAWYRDGGRIYVGKAENLRNRIWKNHLCKGVSMTNSAFRRNVAEHLKIATAADIKAGRRLLSRHEGNTICQWIEECDLAWIKCESEAAACRAEEDLKAEFLPILTKR